VTLLGPWPLLCDHNPHKGETTGACPEPAANNLQDVSIGMARHGCFSMRRGSQKGDALRRFQLQKLISAYTRLNQLRQICTQFGAPALAESIPAAGHWMGCEEFRQKSLSVEKTKSSPCHIRTTTKHSFGCKPHSREVCSQKIVLLLSECETARTWFFSNDRKFCRDFCLCNPTTGHPTPVLASGH